MRVGQYRGKQNIQKTVHLHTEFHVGVSNRMMQPGGRFPAAFMLTALANEGCKLLDGWKRIGFQAAGAHFETDAQCGITLREFRRVLGGGWSGAAPAS